MNAIFQDVLEARKGHYVHAIEVSDAYELRSVLEALCDEFGGNYDSNVVIEFITSLEVYCLNDSNEDEIFNFDIESFVKEILE